MSFLVHGHHWKPVDVDGITLMLRPHAIPTKGQTAVTETGSPRRTGWSNAARHRRR